MIARLIATGCLSACLLAGVLTVATAEEKAEPPKVPKDFVYGLHFLKTHDYPRAIVHLTEAIRTRELSAERLSDAYYFRGRALTRTQRRELALADFTRAITYWPENVKALRVRCRALTLDGKLEKAEDDCDQAVLLAPEDWRSWFTRGLLRDAKDQRILAMGDFSAAQMRMPEGMETFPAVKRQLRAYGLLDDGPGFDLPVENPENPHPTWTEN